MAALIERLRFASAPRKEDDSCLAISFRDRIRSRAALFDKFMKNWCRHRRHDGCILHLSRAAVEIPTATDHLCNLSFFWFDCLLFSVTGYKKINRRASFWSEGGGRIYWCKKLFPGSWHAFVKLKSRRLVNSKSARVNVCCSGVNFKARAVLMCLPASAYI